MTFVAQKPRTTHWVSVCVRLLSPKSMNVADVDVNAKMIKHITAIGRRKRTNSYE